MNTAVFSVIYPGVEGYLKDFLRSLSKQTDKEFSVFLINDGLLRLDELVESTELDIKVKFTEGKTPASNRKLGIQWAIEAGAEILVFADADDYCSENRIEITKELLRADDLVFNELILTGDKGFRSRAMLGSHFHDGERITPDRIVSSNCLGMSNTAVRAKSIPRSIHSIPDDIVAFDWALFALCLHAGLRCSFTNKAVTFYRQHEANVASPMAFSENQIIRGLRIKRDHYRMLALSFKAYLPLADAFDELIGRVQSDETLKKNYFQAVRKNAPDLPLWWEPIKTLEDLGI